MLVDPNHSPIEKLQSALAYLMTRYSSIITLDLPECPACCALTIVQQLNVILAHPEVQSSRSLRDTYLQLHKNWEILGSHQENEHPTNQALLAEAKESGVFH